MSNIKLVRKIPFMEGLNLEFAKAPPEQSNNISSVTMDMVGDIDVITYPSGRVLVCTNHGVSELTTVAPMSGSVEASQGSNTLTVEVKSDTLYINYRDMTYSMHIPTNLRRVGCGLIQYTRYDAVKLNAMLDTHGGALTAYTATMQVFDNGIENVKYPSLSVQSALKSLVIDKMRIETVAA